MKRIINPNLATELDAWATLALLESSDATFKGSGAYDWNTGDDASIVGGASGDGATFDNGDSRRARVAGNG